MEVGFPIVSFFVGIWYSFIQVIKRVPDKLLVITYLHQVRFLPQSNELNVKESFPKKCFEIKLGQYFHLFSSVLLLAKRKHEYSTNKARLESVQNCPRNWLEWKKSSTSRQKMMISHSLRPLCPLAWKRASAMATSDFSQGWLSSFPLEGKRVFSKNCKHI